MRDYGKFYIDGRWVAPLSSRTLDVSNPATDAVVGQIALGSVEDVDLAVAAARAAFPAWSATSRETRLALLRAVADEYRNRADDLAAAVTEEMGAPAGLSRKAQVGSGLAQLNAAIDILQTYPFEEDRGPTRIVREPIGVCALITPWNWPLNQIACKIAPALATGCTMVLKPSEIAPFSAWILAEILDAAGVPAGVFNLVNGDGPTVGARLAEHPDVDMVSFTGSTRAGVEVARAAAPTVKRVCQELGGKSAHIVLDDAVLARSVTAGTRSVMVNAGQSCNAPTRMLVPRARMDEAAAVAAAAANGTVVGDPTGNAHMGPVASRAQWDKVQTLIEMGIAEGATLTAGGPGRPDGLEVGCYVRPTVFADVTPSMTIAREEIFGPVLSILAYDDLDHAVRLANDSDYGLAAYVSGEEAQVLRAVSARLRAGQVILNGASDITAPFGGYRMSGNGREWGPFGFDEFVEIKAVIGYGAD
jgi:aldehyde dehydrogenase (NAD+)